MLNLAFVANKTATFLWDLEALTSRFLHPADRRWTDRVWLAKRVNSSLPAEVAVPDVIRYWASWTIIILIRITSYGVILTSSPNKANCDSCGFVQRTEEYSGSSFGEDKSFLDWSCIKILIQPYIVISTTLARIQNIEVELPQSGLLPSFSLQTTSVCTQEHILQLEAHFRQWRPPEAMKLFTDVLLRSNDFLRNNLTCGEGLVGHLFPGCEYFLAKQWRTVLGDVSLPNPRRKYFDPGWITTIRFSSTG